MSLNLTLQCVMVRIIVVDINPDIKDDVKPDIKDDIIDDDVQGNIYEKMIKISINTQQDLINTKPIKRDATWFD